MQELKVLETKEEQRLQDQNSKNVSDDEKE